MQGESEKGMTLHNFLNTYGGNHCVSIDGYCEEARLEEIMTSSWYTRIKKKRVKMWQTLYGGMYKVEIFIALID